MSTQRKKVLFSISGAKIQLIFETTKKKRDFFYFFFICCRLRGGARAAERQQRCNGAALGWRWGGVWVELQGGYLGGWAALAWCWGGVCVEFGRRLGGVTGWIFGRMGGVGVVY